MAEQTYKERYEQWLNDPNIDAETKAELKSIEGNEKEIEDRFYRELEFGTAGLRGIIGAGTNRMNKYTVAKATQGLADYINDFYELIRQHHAQMEDEACEEAGHLVHDIRNHIDNGVRCRSIDRKLKELDIIRHDDEKCDRGDRHTGTAAAAEHILCDLCRQVGAAGCKSEADLGDRNNCCAVVAVDRFADNGVGIDHAADLIHCDAQGLLHRMLFAAFAHSSFLLK